MALNPDRPFGLRPIGTVTGANWTSKLKIFEADASRTTSNEAGSIFVGDPVKIEADGKITVAAAGETPIGVAVGVPVVLARDGFGAGSNPHGDINHQRLYLPANVAGYVLVAVGEDILYECQEDGDTDPLEFADIGQNVDLVAPTAHGNTVTGLSLFEINSDSHNTTNTIVWRLWDISRAADVVQGDTAGVNPNARWIIKQNLSQLTSTTGV